MPQPHNYISLFSSAGVGCFGLSTSGFECLATVELLERRLAVQRANQICTDQTGYIAGDITDPRVISRLDRIVKGVDLDLLFATPPCQGISVANHKKKNELTRNSLVLSAIEAILRYQPRIFIIENVQGFLTAACQARGWPEPRTIHQALDDQLTPAYNWQAKTLNLKDYGSPSSRTRTIVIGVRSDLEIPPEALFPTPKEAPTLRELIGDLPRLREMGQYVESDPYHRFRPYQPRMRPWISNTPPGKSAFDNPDYAHKPHRVVNGRYVANVAKNGDKYRRQVWDKVAPCVHTRNDILASQNTVHPDDDRVFSIRELSIMMGVPPSFRWSDDPMPVSPEAVAVYMKTHETNIRQCLGEAVPTPVVASMAQNVSQFLASQRISA